MGNIIVSTPNEAVIVSGCGSSKLYVGQTAFALWCFQTYQKLDIGIRTIKVISKDAETKTSNTIDVIGICQVSLDVIHSNKTNVDIGHVKSIISPLSDNIQLVNSEQNSSSSTTFASSGSANHYPAVQNFVGLNHDEINACIGQTLQGHQRSIIASMTIEDVIADKVKFNSLVLESVRKELSDLGVRIWSYTISDISDKNGYIKTLASKQSAKLEAEANKVVTEYKAIVAADTSKAAMAQEQSTMHTRVFAEEQKVLVEAATKEREVKQYKFAEEVAIAQATSSLRGPLEQAKLQKEIVKQTELQKIEAATVAIDVAKLEAEMHAEKARGIGKALLVQKQSEADAKVMTEEANAKTRQLSSQADAEAIKRIGCANADVALASGEAEAKVILVKGKAEADAMSEKAEAFSQYGEAAIANLALEALPQIAREIAAPMSKVGNVTVFASGEGASGASFVTNDMTKAMAQIPHIVKTTTGMDLVKIMQNIALTSSSSSPHSSAI